MEIRTRGERLGEIIGEQAASFFLPRISTSMHHSPTNSSPQPNLSERLCWAKSKHGISKRKNIFCSRRLGSLFSVSRRSPLHEEPTGGSQIANAENFEESSTSNDEIEGEECAICLEKLSIMPDTILLCGHRFHSVCLQDHKSFNPSSLCPLCRAFIPEGPSSLNVGQIANERFAQLMRACANRRHSGIGALSEVEEKEMETILDLWRQSAFSGDVNSIYSLGVMYYDGIGCPQDDYEAVRYWQQAVAHGHPRSQYRLGLMHISGRGGAVKSDLLAEELFCLAARHGHAAAQLTLSQMIQQGRAIPENEYEADRLYVGSALQGTNLIFAEAENSNPEAIFHLACMYRDGRGGLEQSWTRATYWMRKAAQAGHTGGMYEMSQLCMGNDNVEAVRWLRKGSDARNPKSMCALGTVHERGSLGIPKNLHEAARLYRRAAKLGDPCAQANLGRLYMCGSGVKQDYTKGVRILQHACDQGIAPAQNELAKAFEKGIGGLAKDHEKAMELYAASFANGFAAAEFGFLRVRSMVEQEKRAGRPFQLYTDNGLLFTMHKHRSIRFRANNVDHYCSSPYTAERLLDAVETIQRFWKVILAKRLARYKFCATWRKRRDPDSMYWFYENTLTGETQWKQPDLFSRLFRNELW